MEDAKRIAVAGYRQVLEDGKDLCDSESNAEYSDQVEMWLPSEMYTSELIDSEGKPEFGKRVANSRSGECIAGCCRQGTGSGSINGNSEFALPYTCAF
jgi:hypothetical protein